MEPWYSPLQVLASLGLTFPLFIFYGWRIYNLILEHHHELKDLKKNGWIKQILSEDWNRDEMSARLALNAVFFHFDKRLGALRRSLRADVYIIILIGFIGTLLGMIGSFTTLLLAVGQNSMEPSAAIASLVKGGLSTALVSSLIAAVLAVFVMGYLEYTESAVVEIKATINGGCLASYRSQSAARPLEAEAFNARPPEAEPVEKTVHQPPAAEPGG
jgi:hypothetical protein